MISIRLIDVHSHLEFSQFNENLDRIINHAKAQSLIAIIISGIGYDERERVMDILDRFPNYVFGCFGFAPLNFIREQTKIDLLIDFIEENIERFIGIGEIGLDYFVIKNAKDRKSVENIFLKFIDLAMKYKKPIVIHSRDAELRVIELIEEYYPNDRVHMHCYSGPKELIFRIVKNGWMVSVPTSVTRKVPHKNLAELVPLDNMMLESDSPFLAPLKKDKMKNVPGNIAISAKYIADIKNVSLDIVAEMTTKNAINFYKLPF